MEIIKSFNYDKNDFFLEGYIDKFNLNLLNFKDYLKRINLNGKLNSYFKINFNSNLKIEKFNFKILDNSTIISKIDGKSNHFKLIGLGSFDFEKKLLFFKNFLVNNYSLNGSIVGGGSKLKNNVKVSFDKKMFDQSDFYLFKVLIKKLLFKNKNFLNSYKELKDVKIITIIDETNPSTPSL